MSWLQLVNRTAIVTGAASGIGRAVAQTLHDAGCRLVLADKSHGVHKLQQDLCSDADAEKDVITTIECDVSIRHQVDALMVQAAAVDASILVNCAGITRDGRIENLTEQDWNCVMDVNLKGTFYTCQSFLQRRSTRLKNSNTKHETSAHHPDASIINVGSVVSEQGNIGQVNYAASKGGVVGLTRALAKEVARNGVRVNAVIPGFIETPMSHAVPEHILAAIVQNKIALSRLGRPEDVANVIAFLASERSRYITGETIECSGMIAL